LAASLARGSIMKNIATSSNAEPIFNQSTVFTPINK
jgi:hypothetical protein